MSGFGIKKDDKPLAFGNNTKKEELGSAIKTIQDLKYQLDELVMKENLAKIVKVHEQTVSNFIRASQINSELKLQKQTLLELQSQGVAQKIAFLKDQRALRALNLRMDILNEAGYFDEEEQNEIVE